VAGRCLRRGAGRLSLTAIVHARSPETPMIKLKGICHVNLRVADQEVSKRFYRDVLGFAIAEEDPEDGGVFMTLGDNFHTLDIGQHPAPETAQRPQRGQIGLGHDGNTLEIYYELPHALQLFPDGRADQDEALIVSGPGDPLPEWLLEDWPPPKMKARIAGLRGASA